MRTIRVAIAATNEGGTKVSASVGLLSTWPWSLRCPLEIERRAGGVAELLALFTSPFNMS
jgi:hypothetical protein